MADNSNALIPGGASIALIVIVDIVVWAIFYYAGMPLDAGGTAVVTVVIAFVVLGIRALLKRPPKVKSQTGKKK